MTDAIVIGAGPNGLVAANLLADQGWDVTVLEAQPTPGGAVRSARDVDSRYVHDTFSSFYPLAAASPTLRALRLEQHGLAWSNAPSPVGNPLAGGGWSLVHPDPADTAASFANPADGEAWLSLVDDWRRLGPAVIDALLTPFPPVRAGARLGMRLARPGGFDRLRLFLTSVRALGEQHFSDEAGRMLFATNAQHADINPESAGSGFMGWLLVMLGQQYGYPVPVGGAGRLSQALADRFTSVGGTIHCDSRVTEITVRDGRAVGVVTAEGTRFAADRAVLADVSAPALYGDMLPPEVLPARLLKRLRGFEWDPGTVKVDWALDGPIPWRDQPELAPGTVHIAESVDELSRTAAQITAGAVPSDPFLLMGQMTTADPTRSPAGTESVWAYTHVPQRVRHDAGPDGLTGAWDRDEGERMADRIQARVERFAPGFGSKVIARRVLTPHEMQARDANLVGGAVNGGTAALHQQLIFRPVPGLGRAETPVGGLYLASASAHPGGGVHGACGSNAARAALLHDRLRFRK
ncbi:phytoene desaturase family protein [Kribbella deserti]|uniref:Pyridine nucleotide-disulfide oxidoreductase domain-containing protein 2 n=1 Tax=Kribbella deserti TaxID=1926257 RepID=A0ABV6QJ50_9ACTN